MSDILIFKRGSKTILSKNFSAYEFDCECGVCELTLVSIQTINILQMLRDAAGPIHINSGFRCEQHNTAVGGAPKSQHLLGKAADVTCKDHLPVALFAMIEKILSWNYPESCGLRLYSSWIHIDSREKKHRWKYSSVV